MNPSPPKLLDQEARSTDIAITLSGNEPFAFSLEEDTKDAFNAAMKSQDQLALDSLRGRNRSQYNLALYELAFQYGRKLTQENEAQHRQAKDYFLSLPGARELAMQIGQLTYQSSDSELVQIVNDYHDCHLAPPHGDVNEQRERLKSTLQNMSKEKKMELYSKMTDRRNFEPMRRAIALKGVFGSLLGDPKVTTASSGLVLFANGRPPKRLEEIPEKYLEKELDRYLESFIAVYSLFDSLSF